ncbi:MAG: endolytic transglycosylase MltG [Acutalibacteraceae bacterium]
MSDQRQMHSEDSDAFLEHMLEDLDGELKSISGEKNPPLASDDKTVPYSTPASPSPTFPSPSRISLENGESLRPKTQDRTYRNLEEPQAAEQVQPPKSVMSARERFAVADTDMPEEEETVTIYAGTKDTLQEEKSEIGATRVISASEIAQKQATLKNDPSEETEEEEEPEEALSDKKSKKEKKKNKEAVGCLKSIIYVVFVVVIASVLAYYGYIAVVDVTGLGRDTIMIDVDIPEGASTEQIANLLAEEKIIEQPFFFRVFCRLTHADGFQRGTHTLAANFGYSNIVEELQSAEQRDTVMVTIPEGATIDTIAKLMEENNVCPAKDFYTAVVTGNYEDYDFIAELTQEERKDRVYLLEGYLFPDTYEFYEDGSPETAVRKMLDGFNNRVDADTRASIKASGKTLNEVIIEASIAQKEAGKTEDMPRVARVLLNRLNNTAEFPCLQFDSTEDYLAALIPTVNGITLVDTAYNTYERPGLPAGAICNPGIEAINAVLNPSEEENIINCYYFASIVETGESAFFETFEEHEAWCIEHGVGMYG